MYAEVVFEKIVFRIPMKPLQSIQHLLIECADFTDIRQKCYQVPTLQDPFKTLKAEVILKSLKAAVLYPLS